MYLLTYCHRHKNNQVYKISSTKIRTKVGLIPNPNPKQKNQEQKHDMCKTRIQQDFITWTKQEHNKVVTRKRTQN